MSSNRLKLNADKTQFIWFGSPQQLQKIGHVKLMVGGVDVASLACVRDQRVKLDLQLSDVNKTSRQLQSIACICFYTSYVSCAQFDTH